MRRLLPVLFITPATVIVWTVLLLLGINPLWIVLVTTLLGVLVLLVMGMFDLL